MERYSVGDVVEMLVNGWPVDSGTVREIVEDRQTAATIVVIDWERAGRLRQLAVAGIGGAHGEHCGHGRRTHCSIGITGGLDETAAMRLSLRAERPQRLSRGCTDLS